MITDPFMPFENLDEFLLDLMPEPFLVENIRKEARDKHVPAAPPSVSGLLSMLMDMHEIKNILELGTGSGVAALTMVRRVAERGGHIHTIEINEDRYLRAQKYFNESPWRESIHLSWGDFREPDFIQRLENLNILFDLIFIDAAKGQYASLQKALHPHLKVGGLMVFDDIFLHGWVIHMNYPNHRQKTAVINMRKFLYDMRQSCTYRMYPLGVDDGVLVLQKLKEEEDD